jgi:hypothetical protein
MAGPRPPPLSPVGTRVILPPIAITSSVNTDPNLLLDAFDAFTAGSRRSATTSSNSNNNTKQSSATSAASTQQQQQQQQQPDPIDFLNKHYKNEPMLVAMLPEIQEAVSERMDRLDDRISGALQRQSETAEATQRHVQDAKASVVSLEQRIRQVQSKASQSENAVREITKDMKRLDCAKRHLQRTITTLKRLHMLIHAVEQLRLACLLKPFPDFKSASHLVDATRLLLKHFDAYTSKVEPMRLLSQKVTDLQGELSISLVRGFRVIGFGPTKTLELEKECAKTARVSARAAVIRTTTEEEGADADDLQIPMTPETMAGGVLLVDSLGADSRKEFIQGFGQDHLTEYNRMFQPVGKRQQAPPPPVETKRVSSFKAPPPPPPMETPKQENRESGLEFIEKRFAWFRNLLRQIDKQYPGVFPAYWKLQYALTIFFLKLVRANI